MKKFILFLLTIPFIAATTYAPDFGGITQAIGKGDAATLSKYMDNQVDLFVLGSETKVEKVEATAELKKFFATNAVTGFQLLHQGISKDQTSHYGIGDLTAGGKTMRVMVYLRDVSGQFKIQELRFERK